MRALALLGMGLAAVLGTLALPEAAEAQLSLARRRLSAAERERLDRGELVARSTSEERGSLRLMGGVSFQVVEAPPSDVFRALSDVRQWRRLLPQVREARLVERDRTSMTVRIVQGSGPISVRYHLTTRYDEERQEVTFLLDASRRNDIRAAWGFISLRERDGGDTLITYGVMADVGAGMLTGVVRGVVHEWMLKVPFTIKERVEELGRQRLAAGQPPRG